MSENQEEKKGWSWLGFFFAPYYYAGYGNLGKGILYAILGVFPLFGIIIAIISGKNARKDLPIGKQEFKWANVAIIFVLIVVFGFILQLTIQSIKADSSSNEINIVKTSSLEICPDATVEKMVNSFISNPSWEGGMTDEGINFVDISGEITYMNKPVDAVLQFIFSKDNTTFNYNAFEINEIPQNNLTATELLTKMCESAK